MSDIEGKVWPLVDEVRCGRTSVPKDVADEATGRTVGRIVEVRADDTEVSALIELTEPLPSISATFRISGHGDSSG